MAEFNINALDNNSALTDEEGYEIVRFYVNYYWMTNKFYSLKDEMEVEDAVSTVYLKMLKHNHFSKYTPGVTSKKYFVCRAVFTTMVDMLRRHKDVFSLDYTDPETGLSMVEMVEDVHSDVEDSAKRQEILYKLPGDARSKLVGVDPEGNEINVSFRTLALLLERGYSVKEIAGFYKNPSNGKSVTEGCISRYIREMRKYVIENIA